MSKLFSREVKIGLCVLIALVVLFFGINFLKGVNIFKAANYYYASFNSVEGLAVSAPVTLNGFKVGQVRDMEYDYEHPGNVIVEMSLDKDLQLPVGTEAVLSSDILGTATISLKLGNDESKHMIGDHIKGINHAGMMDALSNELMPSVSTIFPKIDTLLTNLNALTSNPALQNSITRLDAITADLQATTNNLTVMSKGLSTLPGQINPILSDVSTISGNVTVISSDLRDLSGKMKDMPLDQLIADLQTTTSNLRELSQQLNDPNSTLGQLTHNPELYNSFNNAANSLDSLLIDIKKNPKRYISIKVF